MIHVIPTDKAKRIYHGNSGDSVLFVNQSAVDVFLDDSPEQLEQLAIGPAPLPSAPNAGTVLSKSAAPPAAGGEVLFSTKTGFIYARAAFVAAVPPNPAPTATINQL